jgi:hypothetical protein
MPSSVSRLTRAPFPPFAGEAMNRVSDPSFWSVEPVTIRQARVLETLVAAGDSPLAIETIAQSLQLPAGALLVTMRSLQHRGLVRAAHTGRGRPAGWTLTHYAVRCSWEGTRAEVVV